MTDVRARARSGAAVSVGLLAVPLFFWGTSFRVTAIASHHSSALILASLRIAPAAIVLLVLMPLLRARMPRGRLAFYAAASGLLMVTLFYDGFTEGVHLAGAANASVLANSSPFFVVLLERVLLRNRISRVGLLGLLGGFAGVVVMVANELGGTTGTGRLLAGLALALAAGAGWGVGTVFVKWLVGRYPELDLVGFTVQQLVVGGLVLLAIGFGAESTAGVQWSSGELWWTIAYLSVGCTVAATLGYFFALRRLSAVRTSAVLFLVPVVAIVVEVARGNTPGGLSLFGMALAICGVALVNTPLPRLEALLGGAQLEAGA